MSEPPGPWPAEVTVRGGPALTAEPRRRPLLRAAVVALAALTVLTGVALGRQEPPTPEPQCPEPCLTPGSIVIGAALPVTGVLAAFGTAQQRGVQRALDRVNDDGGLEVDGERRRVELLVRDTRSEPDVAGQEALVLVRGPYGVVGLIGPCAPPVPMVRVAESRQVPLVTGCQPLPAFGVTALTHTFEVSSREPERAAAVFRALRTSPGRRTGLFLSNGNDRSAVPWTAAAAQAGVPVVGTYRPQGRDWSAAVAQAQQDGVDVVVAVTQPPEGIGLWRELRRRGISVQAAYCNEAGLGSAWRTAVGRAGDGTLTDLVHPGSADAGPVAADEAVSAVSAELTDLLLDGLRRARTPDRAGLRQALLAARTQVAGREARFLGGQVSRLPVRLARWEGGRLVPLG